MGSRWNFVASWMLYAFAFEGHMAKPSWCLAVTIRYFIPAPLIRLTHSSALNFTGSNGATTRSLYSFSGIFCMRIRCSAYPEKGLPFHSPAGPEYTPQ